MTTSPPWDDLERRGPAALRPVHGGVRGDGRQRRPERRATARGPRRARRARRHDLRVPLRQRRVARGRGGRHVGVLPHAGLEEREGHRGPRGGPRAHRPARRAADDGPLPAGLGDGLEHAVAALQDQHPRRRPLGAVPRRRGPNGGDAIPVGERRDQWAFVTDVLPTLLELTGVERPPTARGQSRSSRSPGTTLVPGAARRAAAARRTSSSTSRCRATAATTATGGRSSPATSPLTEFGDHEWELYDLARRPDRAARPRGRAARPGRRDGRRAGRRRPAPTRCTRSTRARGCATSPGRRTRSRSRRRCGCCGAPTPSSATARSCSIQWRSFTVDVELDFRAGDRGRAGRPRRPGRRVLALRRRRRRAGLRAQRLRHHDRGVGRPAPRRDPAGPARRRRRPAAGRGTCASSSTARSGRRSTGW